MNTTIEQGQMAFMNTYAQFPLVLKGGHGCTVTDQDGKEYLDMVAGIAVNSLGYGDSEFTDALKGVLDAGLLHCSNLYYNEQAVLAATQLKQLSAMERVFFCNSGTEANEAALKLARKWGKQFSPVKDEIITMLSSFHGRTYGSMSATGQVKYQKHFTPLVPKILHTPFNDFDALSSAVNENTAAVFIEVIQGEGGIREIDVDFLRKVRSLCDEMGILLIADEVQCGMGRSGKAFAWQHTDVTPDAMTLAKALGNGVPIGALVTSSTCCEVFEPGDHAATFGGNLLSATAANVILKRLLEGDLLAHVNEVGAYFKSRLQKLEARYGCVLEVRGKGLMLAIELDRPARQVIADAMEKGLLLVGAGERVVRFVPPLIITTAEIDTACDILDQILTGL
ncbi:MAG: aspartate aminotransferase family protein [Sphaerochaetaceae bacterium]|nr:aspartate aminotransferase family protein [Sphaerochaetaceae bacterium]